MGYIGGCSLLWLGTHMCSLGICQPNVCESCKGMTDTKLTTFLVAKLRIISVYETLF